MTNAPARPRAIVCGTRFGQVYLESFRDPANPLELAGILAAGSERSQACARHYGVPLFTDPEQIPDDISVACVVVRGGLLGGRGAELAIRLMERGLHVLQEHPLHSDELSECLRQARRSGVVYHVNSFYPHVAPVRRFIAAARELLAFQRPRYIDASCGFQLAYSMFDIIAHAVGGLRPWAFVAPADASEVYRLTDLDVPFRSLDGVLAGVPVTLRVQNQLDPADPDNYAHLMHRITIGTEGGNLTLLATHGPTVWSARPDFPRVSTDVHFDSASQPAAPHLDLPSATVFGPAEAPDFRRIFGSLWSAGVAHALRRLCAAIATPAVDLRRAQHDLTLCELWEDVSSVLGLPQLLQADPPAFVLDDTLAAMVAAGDTAGGDAPDDAHHRHPVGPVAR